MKCVLVNTETCPKECDDYNETPSGFCDECPNKAKYKSLRLQQLKAWVNGTSTHNKVIDECCPDFSCCEPRIQTPKEERELFAELYINKEYKQYEGMLAMFLGRSMQYMTEKKVYISRG